jgi:hypothetical protein
MSRPPIVAVPPQAAARRAGASKRRVGVFVSADNAAAARAVAAARRLQAYAAMTSELLMREICRRATGSRRFAVVHVLNASISRLIALADGSWLLHAFNDTAHLAPPVAEAVL